MSFASLNPPHNWTRGEDYLIRTSWPDPEVSVRSMARDIGVCEALIRKRAKQLELGPRKSISGALLKLIESKPGITTPELCAHMESSAQSICFLLRRMAEAGRVRRVTGVWDRGWKHNSPSRYFPKENDNASSHLSSQARAV